MASKHATTSAAFMRNAKRDLKQNKRFHQENSSCNSTRISMTSPQTQQTRLKMKSATSSKDPKRGSGFSNSFGRGGFSSSFMHNKDFTTSPYNMRIGGLSDFPDMNKALSLTNSKEGLLMTPHSTSMTQVVK